MKNHSSRFLTLVAESKKNIKEISPKVLKNKFDQQEHFKLIDVREESEWQTGHIPSAIHLCKGIIERDIEKIIPDVDTEIVVYCSGGFRCALVAETLQKMGYKHVSSLETGSTGWQQAGFSMES